MRISEKTYGEQSVSPATRVRGEGDNMELQVENLLEVSTTSVPNTFIDEYMAKANGEYIKVYLYLLRHVRENISVMMIADALNHTEADVRRAVAYWQKAGVLKTSESSQSQEKAHREISASLSPNIADAAKETATRPSEESQGAMVRGNTASRPHCTEKEISKLSKDGEFSQLMYIAQKYLNKVFTPTDCEVFAYLYGTLHMSAELLEYLVEYCAQNNHTSVRYVEKVAINWHERKLETVEAARAYAQGFSKDSFAVMKAFGLTGRGPAEKEFEDMERWFKGYGFTTEIVVEACNRTIEAIHTPSFQYAERILKEWKKAGVKSRSDIESLDKNRQETKQQEQKEKGERAQSPRRTVAGKPANRFHNLEEHGYDYDKMMWNIVSSGQSGE